MLNPHYNDVYSTGGYPEKDFVFIHGNRLPERFAALPPHGTFTVAELGFGQGLAFAATVAAWAEHAPTGARLAFVSFEKYPLPLAVLQPLWAELARQYPATAPALSRLMALWPAFLPGWNMHTLPGNIVLHLYLGDAADGLATPQNPLAHHPADAWFLDGHDPRQNPDLWLPDLLRTVAGFTAPGGTAATYSAAGHMRSTLAAAGFHVTRIAGFPPKKHMTIAVKS